MSEQLITGAEYWDEGTVLSPFRLMERIREGRREVRSAQVLLAEQLRALQGREVLYTGVLDSRGKEWFSPKKPVESLRVTVERALEVDPRLDALDRFQPCIRIIGVETTDPEQETVCFHVSEERGSIQVFLLPEEVAQA